ncbi:MAG: hypoxanthine phosphoribosyltransferase [Thermaerobacter sp.]|nr:hypoxanthine phosphoribosyltransferase [Thermaerobacter sp.]
MGRELLGETAIRDKVAQLGRQISADYRGQELLVVGVLKGAVIFAADLVRQITVPVYLDFIAVSSYGKATRTSGVVRILKDLEESIAGVHVLLVEDIADTGLTLHYLRENLLARGPRSLKLCALLDKPDCRRVEVPLDYVGFQIPNQFVVGYGLDFDGRFRNLPAVHLLSREAEKK